LLLAAIFAIRALSAAACAIPYRYWRGLRSGKSRQVSFSKLSLNNESPMTLVDVNIPKTGDISDDFEPYTLKISRKLVTKSVSGWRAHNFAMHITDADVERLIQ
jgi:hypothetical protein